MQFPIQKLELVEKMFFNCHIKRNEIKTQQKIYRRYSTIYLVSMIIKVTRALELK